MDHASHTNPLEVKTATVIAGIWCEVLEVPEVGDDDNFFDLGGHSILLQMVRERVVQHTGKDVGIIELFQHPTVRSLARHLDDDRGSGSGNGRRRPAGRVNRLGNRRARLSGNSSDTLGEPGE